MEPIGLSEWARGERRSGVAEIGLGEQDEGDAGGYKACVVSTQGGFVGNGKDDQVAASRGAEVAARLMGGVRSLNQLLREGQVGADQGVDIRGGARLGRWASWVRR